MIISCEILGYFMKSSNFKEKVCTELLRIVYFPCCNSDLQTISNAHKQPIWPFGWLATAHNMTSDRHLHSTGQICSKRKNYLIGWNCTKADDLPNPNHSLTACAAITSCFAPLRHRTRRVQFPPIMFSQRWGLIKHLAVDFFILNAKGNDIFNEIAVNDLRFVKL